MRSATTKEWLMNYRLDPWALILNISNFRLKTSKHRIITAHTSVVTAELLLNKSSYLNKAKSALSAFFNIQADYDEIRSQHSEYAQIYSIRFSKS